MIDCPSCGQSLRGLTPLPPAMLLRCPECGCVTTLGRIVHREEKRRRSIGRVLLWLALLLLVFVAAVFDRAVRGLGG